MTKGAAERFSRYPPRDGLPSLREWLVIPRGKNRINYPRDRGNLPKDEGQSRDRQGRDWHRDRGRSGQISRRGRDRGPSQGARPEHRGRANDPNVHSVLHTLIYPVFLNTLCLWFGGMTFFNRLVLNPLFPACRPNSMTQMGYVYESRDRRTPWFPSLQPSRALPWTAFRPIAGPTGHPGTRERSGRIPGR